jgi:hypothetical protein
VRTPTQKPRRQRDFRAEYQRRIDRGLKAGKSRAAARGHARAADLGPLTPAPVDRDSPIEKALAAMKRGAPLRKAAADFGVTPERLSRHLKRATTARYERGKWTIFDLRPQEFWIASRGALKKVVVAADDGSEIGRYWNVVNRFLETNDISHLAPLLGDGVTDVYGQFHPFELRPNVLRRLDSIGEFDFVEIYADVVKPGA